MFPLLRLAAGLASRQAGAKAGDAMRRLALVLAAGLLALVGGGFLTAAAWLALERPLGAIGASVVVGGVFCLLALILLLAGSRRRPSALSRDIDALKVQAQSFAGRLPDQVAKDPTLPLMGAFVGGLILALRLRK